MKYLFLILLLTLSTAAFAQQTTINLPTTGATVIASNDDGGTIYDTSWKCDGIPAIVAKPLAWWAKPDMSQWISNNNDATANAGDARNYTTEFFIPPDADRESITLGGDALFTGEIEVWINGQFIHSVMAMDYGRIQAFGFGTIYGYLEQPNPFKVGTNQLLIKAKNHQISHNAINVIRLSVSYITLPQVETLRTARAKRNVGGRN